MEISGTWPSCRETLTTEMRNGAGIWIAPNDPKAWDRRFECRDTSSQSWQRSRHAWHDGIRRSSTDPVKADRERRVRLGLYWGLAKAITALE